MCIAWHDPMSSANICKNPPLDSKVVFALLTFIEVSTFYFSSIFCFAQQALNHAYHQHIKAMQMLDFNLSEAKALHEQLHITIRSNTLTWWASQMWWQFHYGTPWIHHHLLDVPTKMKSITCLNKLAKQFKKWLKNHPKELAREKNGNNQFNFIKSEVSELGNDNDNGMENSDEDEIRNENKEKGNANGNGDADAKGSVVVNGSPSSEMNEERKKHVYDSMCRISVQTTLTSIIMYEDISVTENGKFTSPRPPPSNQLAILPIPVSKSHSHTIHTPCFAHSGTSLECMTSFSSFCAFSHTSRHP